jgi:hypothetical protein
MLGRDHCHNRKDTSSKLPSKRFRRVDPCFRPRQAKFNQSFHACARVKVYSIFPPPVLIILLYLLRTLDQRIPQCVLVSFSIIVLSSSTMPHGSGTNSQGNHYNTPGGTNSNAGGSYHCKFGFWFGCVVPRQFLSCPGGFEPTDVSCSPTSCAPQL